MAKKQALHETWSKKDSNALLSLGSLYYNGSLGHPQDFAKAIQYYEASAKLGNTLAKTNLGYCYLYARGVQADPVKALEYFEDAADEGDINATYKLGDLYLKGIPGILPRDLNKASEFYDLSLLQIQFNGDITNIPDVCLRMGRCFFEGIGREKDFEKAYIFYAQAALFLEDRINAGDKFSNRSLEIAEEALQLCEQHIGKETAQSLSKEVAQAMEEA